MEVSMNAMTSAVDKHHQLIIAGLVAVIVFFMIACTFHDAIPICHYLFGCDHGMHV
jgi:hypothetical protein